MFFVFRFLVANDVIFFWVVVLSADALCRERGQNRIIRPPLTSVGSSWMQEGDCNDATDPDFFVVDISDLREVKIPLDNVMMKKQFLQTSSPHGHSTTTTTELMLSPHRFLGTPPGPSSSPDSPRHVSGQSVHHHDDTIARRRHQAISDWLEDTSGPDYPDTAHSDQEIQSNQRKKKINIWKRRKQRIDTEAIAHELDALEFFPDGNQQDQTISTSSATVTSSILSPRYQLRDTTGTTHQPRRGTTTTTKVRRNRVVPKPTKTKEDGPKSRICHGYDVLHKANMKLVGYRLIATR